MGASSRSSGLEGEAAGKTRQDSEGHDAISELLAGTREKQDDNDEEEEKDDDDDDDDKAKTGSLS